MITQRLYESGERANPLEDPAFETSPAPFVIRIGDLCQSPAGARPARRVPHLK
ncbi:MAG TPA: hypothetical protein VMR25_28415 [Planctomycetaceae bacterium]|jgi:hypothetical protein|nr:hypothetical protein [Planctomycetaceae bacterium]